MMMLSVMFSHSCDKNMDSTTIHNISLNIRTTTLSVESSDWTELDDFAFDSDGWPKMAFPFSNYKGPKEVPQLSQLDSWTWGNCCPF